MHPYNLDDLEHLLAESGWTVHCTSLMADAEIPGQVVVERYSITLRAPDGTLSTGEGDTRSDALREAADRADILAPDQPRLI